MSAIETWGKLDPYGEPVEGSVECGPVVPPHPPRTLDEITKYRRVSKAFPGPIMLSHQPGRPVSALMPAACASPEKACRIKMALEPSELSSPYVS